jgi:Protein of unknown function (DUF2846)
MVGHSRNLVRAVLVCAVLPFVAACAASGPTFTDMHASEPAVAANFARIYFYRMGSMAGSALQPSVKIDGVVVGEATPGGYFYVDEPAGAYEISTATEVTNHIRATVKAGETRYVRFDASLGMFVGHIAPTLVWPGQGESEIAQCHYVGGKTKG